MVKILEGSKMRFLKCLVLSLLLVGVSLWAQPTGTIVGLVQDEEGNAIPWVAVTAKNVQTGLTQTTVTNENGFSDWRDCLEEFTMLLQNLKASRQ